MMICKTCKERLYIEKVSPRLWEVEPCEKCLDDYGRKQYDLGWDNAVTEASRRIADMSFR